MNLFKRKQNLGEPVLTLRLWRFTGAAILNLVFFILMTAYLLPLGYMAVTSVKEPEQVSDGLGAPLYPAINPRYHYQDGDYALMEVPTPDGIKQWAMINSQQTTYAEFIDPQNPNRGPIRWDGDWRTLKKVYVFSLTFKAFEDWKPANLPQGILNSLIVIGISEIGVLVTSIAVAYGFSRFRIPGGKWLLFLLIATILIPDSITILPTYIFYIKLLNIWLPRDASHFPWQWLPLIAPHFFSSAIFVFLLRQNFLSIPRDLDEAAMLDGAGPIQILIKIILPQSIPVVTTVAMLHFFYMWNEFRLSSLYLTSHANLWLLASRLQNGAPIPGINPEPATQAGALLLLIVPVIVLLAFQRFFMQDMVVVGTEK
ncbi:MAG: carbohydrate ABC transporter permease [Anaerolineales bacterium]|nr:carbohydrate ABC transporter permease [Anaerolineales bacterium]